MAELVAIKKEARSASCAFDAHHPPSPRLMDDCVHCGFCLPACPTYLLWREEMDSPRGRIYLMRMGTEGGAVMDDKFVSHFDQCLGCMSCMTACPSGVQYGKLIEATRTQVERNYKRPLLDRLFRRLIFFLFPHPNRLRLALLPMWLYQKLGLQRIIHAIGLNRLLPPRLRSMEALLPQLSLAELFARTPRSVPAKGTKRLRVGLLLGCVQRVLFSNVNVATIRVLSALGCEVIIPRGQGCCGALMTHSGLQQGAQESACRIIEAFERAEVDYVVTNAAGCGSNMKEYPHLLRDHPAFAERAQKLAAKCRDVSEVVAELGLENVRLAPMRIKAAYQDSCHLLHAQGIGNQPRQVLQSIPELKLLDLPEAGICCGSAGIYNLVEPVPARQLADRKAEHIINSGAQVLISANPGCLLQITSAMKRAGTEIPALHTIEVVDAALRASKIAAIGEEARLQQSPPPQAA